MKTSTWKSSCLCWDNNSGNTTPDVSIVNNWTPDTRLTLLDVARDPVRTLSIEYNSIIISQVQTFYRDSNSEDIDGVEDK